MLAVLFGANPLYKWLSDAIQSGSVWVILLAGGAVALWLYARYHLSGAAFRDRMSRTPEEREKHEWARRKALEEKWEAERKRDQQST